MRLFPPILAAVLVLSVASGPVQSKTTSFKNCTALNKVYPGGVALPGAVNKGGKTSKAPKFSAKLYKLNVKMDRDKDGIACEK